ncbi:hypothetical protein H0H81_001260 [Sphagnurus paluster]|uniref:Uncharacterized protein n=1 Tax=Sphagnurus paluster TaxID=117069 RepID=A0A9P7GPZ4_9AGAR|nr:hypothetical protein H0H81_001260 [Sphagnurus paluster]
MPPASLLLPNYPQTTHPVITEAVLASSADDNSLPVVVDNDISTTNDTAGDVLAGDGEESDATMDDASSEVSAGGDLREDLEGALKGDFDFKGSYYYASTMPDAPNPCLNIDGVGLVGLPLSGRDARAIIECSARAPFGHGERTVVDTKVRDTWEIEPAKVNFENPQWAPFVAAKVAKTVCQALGVAQAAVAPRCELYKLLLYEEGSQSKLTEKAEGMFATVVIVLPSPYAGGQVHVSHSTSTKVIDFASTSLLSTSVLAWYTDVRHEVKPLTYGYRLALSYNLIQTVPGVPRPMMPDMNNAVSHLRHVLRKWKKYAYEDSDSLDQNFVAYLLDHEYSAANLEAGAKALKGVDAHLVWHLRNVVEDLGLPGEPGDDRDPQMREIIESSLTLENLVDLDGNSLLGSNQLYVSQENLIPKDPFDGETPDDTEYEGYMGNSDIPTSDDKTMAELVLKGVNINDKKTSALMADYALRWKDLDMWKTVIKKSGSLIQTFGMDRVVTAWKTFNFDGIRSSLEDILLNIARLGDRLNLIQKFAECASSDYSHIVQVWAEAQSLLAFASLASPNIDDIPMLVAAAQDRGAVFLMKEIMPQLVKNPSICPFNIAFVRSLHEHKASIPAQAQGQIPFSTDNETAATDDIVQNLIEELLNTAVIQWDSVVAVPKLHIGYVGYYGRLPPPALPTTNELKVKRIIELVELCLITGHMRPCKKLFLLLLQIQGSTVEKFQTIYIALVSRLGDLMRLKKAPLTPPFSDFLQLLIGSYLRDMLGSPGQQFRINVRKIGCGCADCELMDSFISTSTKSEETFRLLQARRIHLEQRLQNASDLATFETIRRGSPYGVKVTKCPEIAALQKWESRVAGAKTFLRSIGTDHDISQLMGDRYRDVLKAVAGTQPFALTVGDAAKSLGTTSSASLQAPSIPPTSTTPSTFSSNQAPVTHAVSSTATKRKNGPVVHPGDVPRNATAPSSTTPQTTSAQLTFPASLLSSSTPAPPRASTSTAGARRNNKPMIHLGVIDLTEDD